MNTRNQNMPYRRHSDEDTDRWESSYREDWRPEPFDEFRGYGKRGYEREPSYYGREERYFPEERNRREDGRDLFYERTRERNDPWQYQEEYDPKYNDNSHRAAYDYDDEYYPGDYRETGRKKSYKGRYYGRPQSERDLWEIRRRYEESRRRSGWTNAYLPLNNYH